MQRVLTSLLFTLAFAGTAAAQATQSATGQTQISSDNQKTIINNAHNQPSPNHKATNTGNPAGANVPLTSQLAKQPRPVIGSGVPVQGPGGTTQTQPAQN